MSPDRFINCPDPNHPDRKCSLPACLLNPDFPSCLQAASAAEGKKPRVTTPVRIGAPGGPINKFVNIMAENLRNRDQS